MNEKKLSEYCRIHQTVYGLEGCGNCPVPHCCIDGEKVTQAMNLIYGPMEALEKELGLEDG